MERLELLLVPLVGGIIQGNRRQWRRRVEWNLVSSLEDRKDPGLYLMGFPLFPEEAQTGSDR